MAPHLAQARDMRARRPVVYRLLLYTFTLLLALFANRIARAVALYNELGWTATWAEISNWGTSDKTDVVSVRSQRGVT